MWRARNCSRLTAFFIFTVIYFSRSTSSSHQPWVKITREKDLVTSFYDPGIPRATLNLSATEKIELMRYYMSPRKPGTPIALVVDTAEPSYETIKRFWKDVLKTGREIGAEIFLFTYNDTDCSLVSNLKNGGTIVAEALGNVSGIKPASRRAEMIFECVNFALNTIGPESSVTVFTGRRAGDVLTLGESVAFEMIGKQCKLNGIWLGEEGGDVYEEIASKTKGFFFRISESDIQNSESSDDLSLDDDGDGFAAALNLRMTEGHTWDLKKSSGVPLSDDESADMILYDPKISGKLNRPNFARILNPDGNEKRKETLELENMELASLTAVEAAVRLEDTTVEIAPETSLVGRPGTVSRLTFRVTNNYQLTIRHYFQARSTSFNIVYLEPRNAWIEAGQTVNVVADILVPTTATVTTTETVTLTVQGIGSVEKSAYVYVRQTGSTISDSVKPTINYSFNNNCAEKLGSSICDRSIWSVDITVQDSDSGLQRIVSSPRGIRVMNNFVSGTRSSTSFQYAATCCQTSVTVTAQDLLGNSNSVTIDVTTWNNLSWVQIAAIVLGVLLLLLVLAVIILVIFFFIRKRKKSQDLPYTQRYGTRSPPQQQQQRAERTSF